MTNELQLIYKSLRSGFVAKAIYAEGKITVLKGSSISKINSTKLKYAKGILELRDKNSSETAVDENGIVTKNVIFNSPSTAAQFICGSSANGMLVWKDESGNTLKYLLNR